MEQFIGTQNPVASLFSHAEPVLPITKEYRVDVFTGGKHKLNFYADDVSAIRARMTLEFGGKYRSEVHSGRSVAIDWIGKDETLYTVKSTKLGV